MAHICIAHRLRAPFCFALVWGIPRKTQLPSGQFSVSCPLALISQCLADQTTPKHFIFAVCCGHCDFMLSLLLLFLLAAVCIGAFPFKRILPSAKPSPLSCSAAISTALSSANDLTQAAVVQHPVHMAMVRRMPRAVTETVLQSSRAFASALTFMVPIGLVMSSSLFPGDKAIWFRTGATKAMGWASTSAAYTVSSHHMSHSVH